MTIKTSSIRILALIGSVTKRIGVKLFVFYGCAFFALAVILFVGWSGFSSRKTAESGRPKTARPPINGALISLRSFGFEPKDVTRPAGPFILMLDNKSGLRAIDLNLESESGHRLKEIHLSSGQFRAKEALDLTAGNYLLTVASNPQWVCHISITNAER